MEVKQSILVIEDEQNISNFIRATLRAAGYHVMTASAGYEAVSMINSHCPDLILLDLGLPDMDGMEIIREVRLWTQTPIIIVSARTHDRDKVEALDAGADDYVTKPFSTSELLARIRTATRHTLAGTASMFAKTGVFHTGELTVDYNKHQVFVRGENVHLTQNEFRIVALLATYAGRVLTYDFILNELWGPATKGGNNRVLRVHMANIRRKIEASPAEPKYIFTEVGVGYRMAEED